jgi:hypothetical protein
METRRFHRIALVVAFSMATWLHQSFVGAQETPLVKIERHSIDQKYAHELFEEQRETLPKRLDAAAQNPNRLPFLSDQALNVAGYASAIDPRSPEIKPNVRLAAEALAALFVVHAQGGKKVTVPLGGKQITYEGVEIDESYLYSARWMKAFYATTIIQDEALQKQLFASVPDFSLSSTTSPRHRNLLVHALRGWHAEADDTGRRFVKCIDATDPKEYDTDYHNYLLRIDVPQITVTFYCLGEKKELTESMVNAVQRHKEFYSSNKKLRDDVDGFFSLGLTAIAVEAQARGLKLGVESNYLPPALLK